MPLSAETAYDAAVRLTRPCASAALLLALGAFAHTAAAEEGPSEAPLDLEWVAPDACPGRETALLLVRNMVGESVHPTAGALPPGRLSARVLVTHRDDGRWHVRIAIPGTAGGERELDAGSCSALTRAVAVVLAIRLRPSLVSPPGATTTPTVARVMPPPPPAPPEALPFLGTSEVDPLPGTAMASVVAGPPDEAPPPPVRSRHRSWRTGSFSTGATMLVTLGVLPSTDLSAELEVSYVLEWARLELHGETGLVQQVTDSAGTTTAFRAAGGGLRGCYDAPFRSLTFSGCLDGEVDSLWASGRNFPRSFAQNDAWVTLGVALGVRHPLTRWLGVHAFVEPLYPLARPQFVVEAASSAVDYVVHEPSRAWARTGIGLEALFF